MINLDGNYLEGGGQILRTALALSTLTLKSFTITNIRKGRCNPGLKAQHINCVNALSQISFCKHSELKAGATELTFTPGKLQPKNIELNIGTAGSITLVMQSLLLPCLFAKKQFKIKITGGTDVSWSQPIDYFLNVLLPHLKKYGSIDGRILKRGYFPQGGGVVEFTVKPKYDMSDVFRSDFQPINLVDIGKLQFIKGVSHASLFLQNNHVAERQTKSADMNLKLVNTSVTIRSEYVDSLCPGSGVCLWAVHAVSEEIDFDNPIILGADSLGEKRKSSEQVGQEAANNLKKQLDCKAPVDEYLADNLVPFIGVFGGKMKVTSISNHTKTNVYVVNQFLDKQVKINEADRLIWME